MVGALCLFCFKKPSLRAETGRLQGRELDPLANVVAF
jgi:hypothetical protein